MNDERAVEEIITKFLLSTCRVHPRLSQHAAQAAAHCVVTTTYPVDDADADLIPLTTGSVAEFYIEPMLPHVGDVDVMFHFNTLLAVPRGHPPPTQLPAEFHNHVQVHEIVDSDFPGYVYLLLRYFLAKCVDSGTYNAVEYDEELYFLNRYYDVILKIGNTNYNQGPAVHSIHRGSLLSVDQVRCVRCLEWPTQAADWPTRERYYGWPDSATVDRVVNDGCDVVGVAHRQCRQHEWMGESQWRLSFSRAEIVLLNSWTPVQQIVYHVLRVLMKSNQRTNSVHIGSSTLSNYHIKTLMLWACELKPSSWWAESNVVRLCTQLLHTSVDWLTGAQCQHYFISGCSLVDDSFNVTNIVGQLMSVDEKWLSTWFVHNYIRKCSQLCPGYILRLFDNVSSTVKLQNAVSAVVTWRQNNTILDTWRVFLFQKYGIPAVVSIFSQTARSCACSMDEVAKIDSRFSVYFTAVAFLHVAWNSVRHGLTDEYMDILATLYGHSICKRHYYNNPKSPLSLDRATKLMKVAANESLSTMALIAIELSKAYLYRALNCNDSDSDSIFCVANVYLAVSYYATGQHQTAIDHCTLVTRSQDYSQCSSRVIRRKCLPHINDDIDNAMGLAVLYQHLRTAALNQQHQAFNVTAFTTKLFAYYLRFKCLSLTTCHRIAQTLTDEFNRYAICINDTSLLFISDVLLFVSLRRLLKQKFYHKEMWLQYRQPTTNSTEHNVPDLVELLQKSAIEHLTTFHQLEEREFSSVATIVTTDFEALYAYKRGDYQQCLQLCTENVHTLLYAVRMTHVTTLSAFIQLLDDDFTALTALTVIVNPECRQVSDNVCINQVTLSLYLMTQCQLKFSHSVTSLAKTLDYIRVAQRRHSVELTLDRLILKMLARKVIAYIHRNTH